MTTIEIDGKEYSGEYLYREEGVLRKLYIEKKMSMKAIGEVLDTTTPTIQRWLDRNDIERRSRSEARTLAKLPSPVPYCITREGYARWRHKHRGVEERVYAHRLLAVAKYGFDEVAGLDVHHKNGCGLDNRPDNIELVSRGDHMSVHRTDEDAPWNDEDRLESAYQSHTIAELADKWGCNPSSVRKAMIRFDIDRRAPYETPPR